jgi:hypothetical protein
MWFFLTLRFTDSLPAIALPATRLRMLSFFKKLNCREFNALHRDSAHLPGVQHGLGLTCRVNPLYQAPLWHCAGLADPLLSSP